ncbi:hypothetical protein L6452_43499 [Arctium lappa]|uniref:Uncharacterized protein n=1 Tax=Arctium lappa TaxID=4217 RepID=A0ACB8XD42_ARCLA|nr:hypothetical protein L6452_43499 [Arctium lappa]
MAAYGESLVVGAYVSELVRDSLVHVYGTRLSGLHRSYSTSCFVWTGANFSDCWEDFIVGVGTQMTRLTSGQRFFVLYEKEFEIREGRPATTSGIVRNGALGSVLPAVVLSMLLLLDRALTESESCASTLYYIRVGSQSPTILTWGRIGRRGMSCFTLTLSLTCFNTGSSVMALLSPTGSHGHATGNRMICFLTGLVQSETISRSFQKD